MEIKTILDRAAILAALDLKVETVSLPSGDVIIMEICAADRFRLFTDPAFKDTDGKLAPVKFNQGLVALSIVDEDHKQIFTEEEAALFSRTASSPFLKILNAVNRLNGFTKEESEKPETSPEPVSFLDSVRVGPEAGPGNQEV